MPVWKPLCRLCECPTADGAVRATQVDRAKLRNWALKAIKSHGCEDELNEEIKDDDLICYYCIWQSQFMSRHDCAVDESLAWWPKKLRLDAAAKELRKNFFEGEVDQCWVQLETITLPENADSDQKTDKKSEPETLDPNKCIYCKKSLANVRKHIRLMHKDAIRCDFPMCAKFYLTLEEKKEHMKEAHADQQYNIGDECVYCKKSVKEMTKHIRLMHKDAIRCDFPLCATFFHTLEEKKEHLKEAHADKQYIKKEKANATTRTVECAIPLCKRTYANPYYYRKHVKQHHVEYIAKCRFKGCLMYFKTYIELEKHNSLEHKIDKYRLEKRKPIKCEHCPFRADTAVEMNIHTAKKHVSYVLECDICKNKFASISVMRTHMLGAHATVTYQVCRLCNRKIKIYRMARHAAKTKCQYCSKYFDCTGLYYSHLKQCIDQNKNLKCSGCKSKTKINGMAAKIKCQFCRKYFACACLYESHLKICTDQKILKCSGCNKQFKVQSLMQYHMKRCHAYKYKHLGFQCEPCRKYFKSKFSLERHDQYAHVQRKYVNCAHCPWKYFHIARLKDHLAKAHDLIEKNLQCAECPKSFCTKYALRYHVKRTHLKCMERVECTICGISCFTRLLKSHMINIHDVILS